MGILKKIKKIISTEEPSQMSGGNLYEVETQLRQQENIDLQVFNVLEQFDNDLKDVTKSLLTDMTINPYILLMYQANYFCGTCEFETENHYFKRLLMLCIRGAFLYGTSGLLKNGDKAEPLFVTSIEYDNLGNIEEAKVFNLDLLITNMNRNQTNIDVSSLTLRTLNKKECENLALFQWGVMGFSAWITIYPFVQFQNQLLKMIIIQSYSYNKKAFLNIENPTAAKREVKQYFNPANPFIITTATGKQLSNRFSIEDIANSASNDFLEYYEKAVYAYYHILGRRINNDFKKERNVSDEVNASQENYDVIQSDWLKYFEIFVSQVNELFPNAKITIPRNEIKSEEPNENKDEEKGVENE